MLLNNKRSCIHLFDQRGRAVGRHYRMNATEQREDMQIPFTNEADYKQHAEKHLCTMCAREFDVPTDQGKSPGLQRLIEKGLQEPLSEPEALSEGTPASLSGEDTNTDSDKSARTWEESEDEDSDSSRA